MTALCSRASLPSSCVEPALEYQRTIQAKQANLGVSSNFQSVLCLHLAASQAGKSVDDRQMVKLASAKSKPHYFSVYQNAEKILELDQVLSVQEVCVQLGVSHVSERAAKVMSCYEEHLKVTFGEARFLDMNLNRSVYPCAAVNTACKIIGEKIEFGKLCEISKAKKKDLVELCEEMLNLQPEKNDNKGTKKKLDFMDKIMGVGEEFKENNEKEINEKRFKGRVKEDDFEDDGYEDWKEAMLRKAVDEGYTKYKKYLKLKN